MPGLDLGEHQELRRACDVRAGARVGPRRARDAALDRELHQPVPRGVERELVDAPAGAVVADELAAAGRWPRSPSSITSAAPSQRAEPRHSSSNPAAPSRRSPSSSASVAVEQVVARARGRQAGRTRRGVGEVMRPSDPGGRRGQGKFTPMGAESIPSGGRPRGAQAA